jgi:hypothetical protein
MVALSELILDDTNANRFRSKGPTDGDTLGAASYHLPGDTLSGQSH